MPSSNTLVFVVAHQTGGWSGTETYTSVAHVFSTRERAERYVTAYLLAIKAGKRHDNLDQFEIHKAFMDDDDV